MKSADEARSEEDRSWSADFGVADGIGDQLGGEEGDGVLEVLGDARLRAARGGRDAAPWDQMAASEGHLRPLR